MSNHDSIDSEKSSSPLQAPTHGPPFEEPKENQMLELKDYPELRYRALCFDVDGGTVEITKINSDSDKVAEDPSFFNELMFRLKTLYRNLR